MPSNGLPSVRLVGVGAALPTPCLSNDDLSQIVETSDEWIWPRTGIRQRRILPPDLSLVDLAAQAAKAALAQAGIPPQELDLILLATSTGVDRFGSAPRVQAALGATRAVAFDLTAACTGLCLCSGHGGAVSANRAVPAGAGGGGGRTLSHSGLDRSHHLCPIWGRGRGGGAGSRKRGGRRHPQHRAAQRWQWQRAAQPGHGHRGQAPGGIPAGGSIPLLPHRHERP
jgi:hypothetical protein